MQKHSQKLLAMFPAVKCSAEVRIDSHAIMEVSGVRVIERLNSLDGNQATILRRSVSRSNTPRARWDYQWPRRTGHPQPSTCRTVCCQLKKLRKCHHTRPFETPAPANVSLTSLGALLAPLLHCVTTKAFVNSVEILAKLLMFITLPWARRLH